MEAEATDGSGSDRWKQKRQMEAEATDGSGSYRWKLKLQTEATCESRRDRWKQIRLLAAKAALVSDNQKRESEATVECGSQKLKS